MWNLRVDTLGLLILTGLFVAGQKQCIAIDPQTAHLMHSRKDPIVIAIRPNIQIESRVIRLGDVSTVTGGDAVLREKLKQLDLEDALPLGEVVMIMPTQIEIRLRIAGIDSAKVSIRGEGSRVTVGSPKGIGQIELANGAETASQRMTRTRGAADFSSTMGEGPLEREIVKAAKACIVGKLPWTAENIDIRLSQPVATEVREAASADGYRFSAEIRSNGPAIGRVQVRVIAEALQKPSFDVSLAFDVRHFDSVVLTTKTLERGHTMTVEDMYVDRQDVTELTDYCSSMSDLIGTTTKRSVRALLPLRKNDIELTSNSHKSVLIKRREQVKMVARVGGLNISAMGEALQDGHAGEVIQLRNLDSKATVQGRVVNASEVEIAF